MATNFAAGSLAANPPASAGSLVESKSEIYYSGIKREIRPIPIKVPQVFGIVAKPEKIRVKVKGGSPVFVPCHIENIGNGTDIVTVAFNKKQSFLDIALVVDDNNDGVHANGESALVPQKIKMSEGAVYSFFIRLVANPAIVSQAEGDAVIRFTGSSADGPAYVGYNGARYGGADKASVMVQAQVE